MLKARRDCSITRNSGNGNWMLKAKRDCLMIRNSGNCMLKAKRDYSIIRNSGNYMLKAKRGYSIIRNGGNCMLKAKRDCLRCREAIRAMGCLSGSTCIVSTIVPVTPIRFGGAHPCYC